MQVDCHPEQEDGVAEDEARVPEPGDIVGNVVGQVAALVVAVDGGE